MNTRGVAFWWLALAALFAVTLLLGTPTVARAQDEAAEQVAEEAEEAVAAEEEVAEEAVEEQADSIGILRGETDVLWTCLAAFLVFFMQAGFCAVEAGFTRAKNVCNIVMKNLMDFSVGSVAFWAIGFGLMFGATNGWIGQSLFMYDAVGMAEESGLDPSFGWAFLIFQTVFAATAATIVSGAMAERTKFIGYLCYSAAICIIVYPIFGSWAWNGLVGDTGAGWLEGRGFLDFAGSTVVHSIGGWAALAGAIVLGPRIGKYAKGGIVPIPGHNIPLAAMGVFILWLGWFGFNPGSTTAVGGGDFARIAVMTNLAAAAGAIVAMLTSWAMFKKPDSSFALNGALAGLVAITAGCDVMGPATSLITGAIAGALVVFSVLFFDRIRVDDPVGAISVHGVCGAWGTLAIGLIAPEYGILAGAGAEQLITQAIGVGAGFAWAFPVSLVIFLAIKYTVGLRVSEEEELQGLDLVEHGMLGYPAGFVADSPIGSPVSPVAGTGAPSLAGASMSTSPKPQGA